MEAHVHVVFPQDPVADAGRHGRGESVKAAAASGPCAVVWERHGRAEELGEFLRRALVHALQRHGEVERIEDTLRDLVSRPSGAAQTSAADARMKQLCGDICLSASVYLSGPRASADILPGLRIAIELFRNWPVLRLSRGRLDKHDALSAFFGLC